MMRLLSVAQGQLSSCSPLAVISLLPLRVASRAVALLRCWRDW